MRLVSILYLSRNSSAVVDEVERSGWPPLVTRKPIAALVRIVDQDRLVDWLLSTLADPPIGMSLDESRRGFALRPGPSRMGNVRSAA